MRRGMWFVLVGLVGAVLVVGCGSKFDLPTERRVPKPVPSDKSYGVLQTWKSPSVQGALDIFMTRGSGAQLFVLFNTGGSGGPSAPRGKVQLFSFTQPKPIGTPIFDEPRGLFNPIALTSAESRLFVLDEGDSCMAKFDPERNTCEADITHNGRRSQVYDYSAIWRVREYPLPGGDTISTFTDTSFAYVHGIAADDGGRVYVSGYAVILDTSSTDARIRTRKFVPRIYRYLRGPRYAGVVPNDVNMPGANWHRDSTWVVLDGTGSTSVNDARGISWTPLKAGALFVSDRGNNKAKLISSNDGTVGFVRMDGSETPTGTSFSGPSNVAVDAAGYLYVVDRLNSRVLRYDPDGNYVQDVNVEKNDDGLDLGDPSAVAVDDSLAYVVDRGRSQIIRYKRRP